MAGRGAAFRRDMSSRQCPAALLISCASVWLSAAGCGGGGATPAAAPPPAPVAVRVAAVTAQAWPRTILASGTLGVFDSATVGPKQAGRVEAVLVDRGDRVSAGQPIARLDATDAALEVTRAQAALAEARAVVGLGPTPKPDDVLPAADDAALVRLARAQLDEARANHLRVVALRERGVATPQELDAVDALLRAAQGRVDDALEEVGRRRAAMAQRVAELAIARQRLDDAVVPSPFDGVVLERLCAPGDVVVAGAPLVTIVRVDPLRLRAEIPERAAALVRPGQRVFVRVDGLTTRVEAKISRVSPALAEASRTLLVEADVPNPDLALRAGAFVRVEVVVDETAQAAVAPANAVRSFAGLDKLLVVEGGKAVERRVTIGRRDADRVELLSGVAAGAQVVLDPGGLAHDAPVTVEAGPRTEAN